MRKLLLIALFSLFAVQTSNCFANFFPNLKLQPTPALKAPENLSEDERFISIVRSDMEMTMHVLTVLKQKSVDPKKLKKQIEQVWSQNLDDLERLDALDAFFKQPMAAYLEEQNNFQAWLLQLEKQYEPISDQTLANEYKEVAMKLFDNVYPNDIWCDDVALLNCVLTAQPKIAACYKACRTQGQFTYICLEACGFDRIASAAACVSEHCVWNR